MKVISLYVNYINRLCGSVFLDYKTWN